MLREGTAFVELRVLTPGTPAAVAPAPLAPPPTLAGGPGPGLFVQPGAFADMANARRPVGQLRAAGFDDVRLLPEEYADHVRAAEAERGKAGRARAVADYVAGMTDRFAMLEHRRLFDPGERT